MSGLRYIYGEDTSVGVAFMDTWDAIVIGSGQAGQATGYHLQKAGARFLILEAASEPGGSWPCYYDSLKLFSPARYSSLPGLPFPGDPDRYPLRDEVTDYLRGYAKHFRLPIVTNTRVSRVQRLDGHFDVETGQGPAYRSRSLVAATGSFHAPHVPQLPGQDVFRGEILHAAAYRGPEPYTGKRVIVVGAANSAVQIAAELAQRAHVTLATRGPVRFVPQRILGCDLHCWLQWTGLDYCSWLKDQSTPVLDTGIYRRALRANKPEQRPMFQRFTETGVAWSDGTEERIDAVIFATGYRPNYPYLAELGALDQDGTPRHRKGVSTVVPGLYFVGLSGQRSFRSATLRGVGPDAAYVVGRMKGCMVADSYSSLRPANFGY
jgi:putative flavoprotein involved in K+ transport